MSTVQTEKPYYSEKVQEAYEKRKAEETGLVESYKSNINLVTYLAANGWNPVRGKHTQNWAAMEEGATGRKLMIHRVKETGHYAYKSFQDNHDKGTIINLVSQQLALDLGSRDGWKQLHAHLSPMVGNLYAIHESIRPTGLKDLDRLSESATAQLLNIQPLQDRSWLHSRHINDSIIDSPEFKGQIVQRPFETKSGYTGMNTAFPIRKH